MKMCALFLLLLRFSAYLHCRGALAGTASVIDGDTIEVHVSASGFHGIDAPEEPAGGGSACGPMVRLGAVANRRPWPCPTSNRSFRSSLRIHAATIAMAVSSPFASRTPEDLIADGRQWLGCGVSEILTRLRGRIRARASCKVGIWSGTFEMRGIGVCKNSIEKPQQEPSVREYWRALSNVSRSTTLKRLSAVLRIKARGHRDLITVIGPCRIISAGEWVTASGDWVNDHTHGQQFKARFMPPPPRLRFDGIEKYLGSGDDRGIGRSTQEDGEGVRGEGVRYHRGRAGSAVER